MISIQTEQVREKSWGGGEVEAREIQVTIIRQSFNRIFKTS